MDSVNFISDQYHTISKQKTDESEKLKQIDDSVTKMSSVNEELRKGLKYLKYGNSELKEDLLDLKSHTNATTLSSLIYVKDTIQQTSDVLRILKW